MIKKFKKKLNNRSGESISETLVALLISALALVMLAGAITSASRVIIKSRDKLDQYYDNIDASLSSAGTGGETATIVGGEGSAVQSKDYEITYYQNDEFGNVPVIIYNYKFNTSGGAAP